MSDQRTSCTGESLQAAVIAAAERAKRASVELARTSRATKDRALLRMAETIVARSAAILAANAVDVERARAAGAAAGVLDRLLVTPQRLAAMAGGLQDVAALPDPVGVVVRGGTLPNGLRLEQRRVPLGVVAIIYEARPNVTVDAAGLTLKAGNAVLLRGSQSARDTNRALIEALADAAAAEGLPCGSVAAVPGADRDSVTTLLGLRGLVDVVIPRGGAGLIASVVEQAKVPVIETGVGNCHIYLDRSADPQLARAIVLDAKTSRPSVCNAVETLLVHRDSAHWLPDLLTALDGAGVRVHGDAATIAAGDQAGIRVLTAGEADWETEYLSLDLAVAVVADLAAALEHIRRYSSGHTEAIVTADLAAADQFVAGVDSAAVMVNASTRFTDGGEFGFGAEIGISTQKLHARGPMGLAELTTTTYVVTGSGQVRG